MSKIKLFLLMILSSAAIVFYGCSEGTDSASTNGDNQGLSQNQYIVVFNDNAFGNTIQSAEAMRSNVLTVLKNYGVNETDLVYVYESAIQGFCSKLSPEQAEQLKLDKRVRIVEQDREITLDDPVIIEDNPKSAKFQAETVPWGITRVGGYVDGTSNPHIAWIIDTGINLTHPELNVQTSLCKNFVSTRRNAEDDNGHGTHVAGTIAARHNTSGVVGVCAGGKVVGVKVLNKNGSGTYSQIIAGINYVASKATAGDVANMSFGGGGSTALDNAVLNLANQGVFIAIAAGNSAAFAGNYSPARVNHQNVFTASALDVNDVFAYFSNWGNPPVDWCSPGVSIYSTYKNKGYATMSGTSMAAPHLAGILLATGGTISSRGNVSNDPDGNPDQMATR
ncbi:MAG: S8 family peptidase [Ignavibacteriae bacterium]|nr:S8 family peptidase [Ignavibacteriota bacterium]